MSDIDRRLFEEALKAKGNAYAIYSGFKVGAAVLTSDGRIFSGCNIENTSLGATICAERVAIGNAVSAGCTAIHTILIVAEYPEPISPCGICRQVIAEFGPDARVIMTNTAGDVREACLDDVLPFRFCLARSEKVPVLPVSEGLDSLES